MSADLSPGQSLVFNVGQARSKQRLERGLLSGELDALLGAIDHQRDLVFALAGFIATEPEGFDSWTSSTTATLQDAEVAGVFDEIVAASKAVGALVPVIKAQVGVGK